MVGTGRWDPWLVQMKWTAFKDAQSNHYFSDSGAPRASSDCTPRKMKSLEEASFCGALLRGERAFGFRSFSSLGCPSPPPTD